MIKSKLLIFISLMCFTVCSAQFVPAKAILKSGDTLNRILGKLKSNTFKYKTHSKAKAKEINFSEIKSIQIKNANNDIETIYLFKIKGENKFVPVQKFITGDYLEVYAVLYYFNSAGAGGMSMSGSAIKYYVKKNNEDELTFIGAYDALVGEFKRRVYNYFSDCELLIKKLENKELRLRNGLEDIANFYNENCQK